MIPENLSELTAPALRKLAAEHNVKGRSTMTKPSLIEALSALRTEAKHRARAVANVPEEAVRQAARDDETVTLEAIGHIPVSVMVAKPSVPPRPKPSPGVDSFDMERFNSLPDGSMTALFIGNSDYSWMNDAIDSFHMRAVERYLKDGRKRLTARQARRVGKKINALMGRMVAQIHARVA
jgi:nucleoid DNA-binding protein